MLRFCPWQMLAWLQLPFLACSPVKPRAGGGTALYPDPWRDCKSVPLLCALRHYAVASHLNCTCLAMRLKRCQNAVKCA